MVESPYLKTPLRSMASVIVVIIFSLTQKVIFGNTENTESVILSRFLKANSFEVFRQGYARDCPVLATVKTSKLFVSSQY